MTDALVSSVVLVTSRDDIRLMWQTGRAFFLLVALLILVMAGIALLADELQRRFPR